MNKVFLGDCLELMKDIPDGSIDMILCDLPYGTTACKWDTIIPFDLLWEAYERIIKDNGAIVLFGSEPFSSQLRVSNLKRFRYDWVWIKTKGTGFMNSKKMPLKYHETVSVFYKSLPTYNPQGLIDGIFKNSRKKFKSDNIYNDSGINKNPKEITSKFTNYPKSYFTFKNGSNAGHLHPTQKPVALFEYLIKTYTNEGETVLDNCAGSGTTAIACLNTKRNYICMEKDPEYFDIIEGRIKEYHRQPIFF